MTADTLVEARWVIPVIPRNTVLENHTVVFSGGRIADILPTEAARVRYAGLEAKTMRLPAGVVMPGLIDPHLHLGSMFGSAYGTRMAAAAGVTTCLDMAGPVDEILETSKTCGEQSERACKKNACEDNPSWRS